MKTPYVLSFMFLTLWGCSSSRPMLTYDAISTDEIASFYVDGLSIASCHTDSCYFSISINQKAVIGGYGYLRVWLLYQNLGVNSCLLRPWTVLKLSIIDTATGKCYSTNPATPNELLTKVDKQEAAQNFLSVFGGALQALNVSSSNMPSRFKTAESFHIVDRTAMRMLATQTWYDVVRSSVSSSILNKNTVVQDASVNGYVYFPLQIDGKVFSKDVFKSKRWKCVVEVLTPSGYREVEFIPTDLE
jgi:hypothetical protein